MLNFLFSYYHVFISQEDFLDLQMVLMGCTSLSQSLEMFYVMLELMDGSNQYMCDACRKLVNATRVSMSLYKIFHLFIN